ncbi:MAG: flagellar biosynthetic protein FliO [Treponemataceae bacterium]
MAKRFLCLIFALAVGVTVCFSQNADTKPTENTAATKTIDETKIRLQTQPQDSARPQENGVSFFGSLWKLILMLLIVCVLAYVVLRFLKKSQTLSLNDDPYLKVVSSLKLAPNKSLYIITVKREAFLIAVTEKDVSLISRIEDTELIDTLNLHAENQTVEQKPFAEMVSVFFKKENKPVENTARETSKADEALTGNFLEGMRERLQQNETDINESNKG